MPEFKSKRYQKAIKESINKLMGSKSCVHPIIAKYIAEYSHTPLLKSGSTMMDDRLEFFIVEKMLSTHFLQGYYCPYKLASDGIGYWYIPNHMRRQPSCVKLIMDPFGHAPFVKSREKRYYLVEKKQYEPLPSLQYAYF